MRTDPRKACANEEERAFWAAFHDLIAHPLLVLSWYSRWAVWLHDKTSMLAWPRGRANYKPIVSHTDDFGYGRFTVIDLGDGFWRVQHGNVDHAYVTQAQDKIDAVSRAIVWFDSLADQLGGKFKPTPLH